MDTFYLTTFDGKQLFIPDEEMKFLTWGNAGAPPVNFITRKGYRQHGVTEVDYLLEPRTITVELWQNEACNRQQYWDNRLALHEFLRHNRNGPIQFVLRQPNGNLRALTVRANPGLQFPMPAPTDNNWLIDEAIDLIAFDPIWFNPDSTVLFAAAAINAQLIFPITFPIWFGLTSYVSTISITYPGTWKSYPTLTLTGPYSGVLIENLSTNIQISLSVPIGAGERRIIDLTPGAQRIIDGFGLNRFGDLDASSNLVDFNIRPDPEVAGGIQTIQATFAGGLIGTTAIQVEYLDRYFAL